jgi:subtilisin family serine protease
MNIRRWLGSAALAAMALAMVVAPAMNRNAAAQAAQAAKLIRSADPVPGLYVVVLAGRPAADAVDSITATLASNYGGTVTHVYKYALQGFAIETSDASAIALSTNPAVQFVQEAGRATLSDTQPNPPWGLDRIDQRDRPLNGTYRWGRDGQGVNVYIFDTGIYYSHNDFGGRARFAIDTVGGVSPPGSDCVGHGTHVAGTVGGTTYGVAKEVTLYSVRVVDCERHADTADVVQGVDYVTSQGIRPAIANMSLGFRGGDAAIDLAIVNSINAGVTYVVSAGNSAEDARNQSPARIAQAITVAASALNDTWAGFSNHGPAVDIIAPGVQILSAGHTSPDALDILSGTSMASPHVAGAGARCLQANPGANPGQVTNCILSVASVGRISGVPGSTVNRLLYALPPPTAPANLEAFPMGSTEIQLEWTDSLEETGYVVERRLVDGPWHQLPALPENTTNFLDSGLAPATTYVYRVRAFNSEGAEYSNEASATTSLPAPSHLTATALTSTRIRLTWNDNSPDEDGFEIERRTGAEPFTLIAVVPGGQTTYDDSGLQPDVIYTYRVRAFIGGARSGYSNHATATTLGIPPAPTAIEPFGCGASLTPTLHWEEVPFATKYRATVADVATPTVIVFQPIVNGPPVTVPPGLLQPGRRYQWQVRGRNAANEEGPPSSLLVFATEACRLSIGDTQGLEGTQSIGSLVFTISLSEATSLPVSVTYATADGSARAGRDYTAVPPTPLLFPRGTAQLPVTINLIRDSMDEHDEDLFVQLSSPVGAVLERDRGRGVIQDDDDPPSLSISDAIIDERTGSNGVMFFAVTLSAVSGKRIEVQYLSADGTGPTGARSGQDYAALQGRLVFEPESGTGQTLVAVIAGDGLDEYTEHFFVDIAPLDPTTVSGGDRHGVGTILDDDPPPVLSVPPLSRREGSFGPRTLTFTFELSAVSGKTVEVGYETRDGSATVPSDYVRASGLMRLLPGELQGSTEVQIVGDTDYEPAENFFLDLSGNPEDITLPSPPTAEGTILNDDRACQKISDVPHTIVASGVYCLDRDLARVFRDDVDAAITVSADHVVVDLNGFTLRALLDSPGPAPGPGPTRAAGIHALNRTHVTVKNGTIRGFHRAVFLEGVGDGSEGDQGHVVEGVSADGNAHEGIVVEGSGSLVRRNRVLGTGGGEVTADNHGIRVTGLRPQVVDNDVAEIYGSGDGHGHGIHVESTGAVVERNRVGNTALVDGPASGIVLLGTETLVVGNRLSTLDRGIVFVPQGTGKYRDNLATGVTIPYAGGGTDAGNNQ